MNMLKIYAYVYVCNTIIDYDFEWDYGVVGKCSLYPHNFISYTFISHLIRIQTITAERIVETIATVKYISWTNTVRIKTRLWDKLVQPLENGCYFE